MTRATATCLWTRSVRVLLLLAMFASTMLPVRAETDIPHGKTLVEANCARCHAIGRTDTSAHPDAPAFRTLSQRYPLEALEEAFAEGISTGHPDMPEFVATPDSANKTAGTAHGTRCILIGIGATPEFVETPALEYAISLAADCGASLSLYVFAPPPSAPWPVTTGSASVWVEHETERLEQQTAAATRAAGKLVSQAGVDLATEHANALFEPRDARFVQLARVNDLAVLDAAAAADSAGRTVIEDVLFDSGRPAVVIPQFAGNASPRRIAIAWDGSSRAARAVKDALPFLIAAELVVAVTITGEKDLSRMAPGADLATYLARHGVQDCKLATLAGAGGDVAARLRLFVAEEDIEMIVLGAFVHSRFREAVLGGVTRSMLDDAPVPLFLAH